VTKQISHDPALQRRSDTMSYATNTVEIRDETDTTRLASVTSRTVKSLSSEHLHEVGAAFNSNRESLNIVTYFISAA
jgi:hypothetical protein